MIPVLRNASQIEDTAAAIRDSARVAVDTEFHPERRQSPALYVVSIATEAGEVFLIDGTDTAALRTLREPMSGKPWVLHGGRMDLPLLEPTLGRPDAVVDTQILGGLCSPLYPARLEQLLADDPEAPRSLEQTMSDWSQRPLTPAQRAYCAADVRGLLDLADRLETRVIELDRQTTIEPAMAEFVDSVWSNAPTWRSLRGAERLDPIGAAIVDELLTLRDKLARETNSPSHTILGDGHILDLAKRRPITPEAVGRNRRFPRRVAQAHGAAIADCIQRVFRRAPEHLPATTPRGSQREAEAMWWRAQALLAGRRDQWAAPLWTPEWVIDALVDARAVEGWRARVVQPWQRALRPAFQGLRERDPHSPPS